MKTLILFLSWCAFCFAGSPGHVTTVEVDFGCIVADVPINSGGLGNAICAGKKNLLIVPDTDNMYYMTIYSGFPDNQRDRYVVPQYKQDYTWWEDHDRVSVDQNNCLNVAKYPFFPTDVIGRCPPEDFPTGERGVLNPNWKAPPPLCLPRTTSSQSDNEGFVASDPTIPLLEGRDISSGSFCSADEGGEGDSIALGAEGGTIASLDLSALSNSIGSSIESDDSIFDDNGSFSSFVLNDPNNNANMALDPSYDTAFVSNDFGERQDYSPFHETG